MPQKNPKIEWKKNANTYAREKREKMSGEKRQFGRFSSWKIIFRAEREKVTSQAELKILQLDSDSSLAYTRLSALDYDYPVQQD